jgi:hypothetical protein
VTPTSSTLRAVRDQPLNAVRSLRESLLEEERQVSYWRRLVQGRLDLVRARLRGEQPAPSVLAGVEAQRRGTAPRRSPAAVALQAPPPESPLRAVEELWEQPVPWRDEQALAETERTLMDAETELSSYRRQLHNRIDLCTGELIDRYRRDLAQVPGVAVLSGASSPSASADGGPTVVPHDQAETGRP